MRYSLDTILTNDPLALLEVAPKFSGKKTEIERLVSSFEEINEFFVEHQRVPTKSKEDIIEFALACRLQAIKSNTDKLANVNKHDRHNLLEKHSVATILQEDSLGLLDDDGDDSIFELTHVPAKKAKLNYIANRKPCKDFARFATKFEQCQLELEAGRRKMIKFKRESTISQGEFFVLNGVVLYIASIGEKPKGINNPRLRCIFANGTEGDMLLRSLASSLYRDGKRIVAKETGYIYVVKSASSDHKIASLANLYKIGYSTTSVKQRLHKAEQSATYLYAPVKLVAKFKCYNINTQKLEYLLHTFFADCCLDLQVNGHKPREWFVVPLAVITQAIELLIDGGIADYRYDRVAEEIRPK